LNTKIYEMEFLDQEFIQKIESYQKKVYEDNKNYFDLNDRLLKETGILLSNNRTQPNKLSIVVVDFLCIKAFKTYWAMMKLCNQCFVQDAGILLRSLFETLVNILYIGKSDPEKRAKLYIEYDHMARKDQLDKVEKWLESHPDLQNSMPDKITTLKSFNEVRNNYPHKRYWSGKTMQQMAYDVKLEYDYDLVYWFLSNLHHSGVRSSSEYISYSSDEEEGSLKFKFFNTESLKKILFHGFWYMLIALKEWNRSGEIGKDDIINEFANKFSTNQFYKHFFEV